MRYPERLSELFHHYHQALTPELSVKHGEGRGSWREVPQPEKGRLVAAVRLALLELESMTGEPKSGDRTLPNRAKQNGAAELNRKHHRPVGYRSRITLYGA